MKNKIVWVLIVVAIVLALILLWAGQRFNQPSRGIVWNNDSQVSTSSSASYVSIAGFDRAVFTPMETTQNVKIYNPKNNTCMMSFAMYIGGEEVWAADDIQAGHGFTEIDLNRGFETGEYSGLMKIKCYDPSSGKQMNNASFEFNVIVKQ